MTTLCLRGCANFNDAALKPLKLTQLELRGTQVSGAGLRVACLAQLVELVIELLWLEGDLFAACSLQALTLVGCKIPRRLFRRLSTTLEKLELEDCEIFSQMAELVPLPVRSLKIDARFAASYNFEHLVRLTALRVLHLPEVLFQDNKFELLVRALSSLETLNVRDSNVTNGQLQTLSQALPGLLWLDISNTLVTTLASLPQALRTLLACGLPVYHSELKLSELHLDGTADLVVHEKLRVLHLSYNETVCVALPHGLRSALALQELTVVNLRKNAYPPLDLEAIMELPMLENLTLSRRWMTDDRQLARLRSRLASVQLIPISSHKVVRSPAQWWWRNGKQWRRNE